MALSSDTKAGVYIATFDDLDALFCCGGNAATDSAMHSDAWIAQSLRLGIVRDHAYLDGRIGVRGDNLKAFIGGAFDLRVQPPQFIDYTLRGAVTAARPRFNGVNSHAEPVSSFALGQATARSQQGVEGRAHWRGP